MKVRWQVLGLVAAGLLVAPEATARSHRTMRQAHFLRLDEAPRLWLLRNFRRPQGRRHPRQRSYLDGPFARWWTQQWQVIDWPDNPALAVYSPEQDSCLERLVAEDKGYPYRRWNYHPFYQDYASSFVLADRFLSPWLKRVDPHLSSWILRTSGCHRLVCPNQSSFPALAFFELYNQWVPRSYPIPAWKCRERPVRVMSMGREQRLLTLIPCDGSVSLETLQQLSSLARMKSAKPAQEPWSSEPKEGVVGEWQPGVRLLHPRLLWLLHTIADTYRWRAIYIYSGYRRRPGSKPGSHRSMHHVGRALDIQVQGVANEHVLRACNRQPDTGCGYYPNGKFVHIDVRPEGSGRAVWVDSSAPGEASRYVSSWPGVYENGRVISSLRPEK